MHELRTKQGHEGNRKRRKEEQGRGVVVIEDVNLQLSLKVKHGEKRDYGLARCTTRWRVRQDRRLVRTNRMDRGWSV